MKKTGTKYWTHLTDNTIYRSLWLLYQKSSMKSHLVFLIFKYNGYCFCTMLCRMLWTYCSGMIRYQSGTAYEPIPFVFLGSPPALLCQFSSAKIWLFLPFPTSLLLPRSNFSFFIFFFPKDNPVFVIWNKWFVTTPLWERVTEVPLNNPLGVNGAETTAKDQCVYEGGLFITDLSACPWCPADHPECHLTACTG